MPREEDKTRRGATTRDVDRQHDEDRRTEDGKDQVQESSEDSFPASDPPSNNGHA